MKSIIYLDLPLIFFLILFHRGRDHGYQTPVRGVQPAKHLEFNVSDEISTAIYNASHNFDK